MKKKRKTYKSHGHHYCSLCLSVIRPGDKVQYLYDEEITCMPCVLTLHDQENDMYPPEERQW